MIVILRSAQDDTYLILSAFLYLRNIYKGYLMLQNLFVFDIETVPDCHAARRLHSLKNMDDAEVAEAMFALRRQTAGNDFLPHYLQKIVAISVVFHSQDRLKVWSLGEVESTEKELIERFFSGLEKYTPNLVSWNGSGFDLPVLHYRALLHGVNAARYWEIGDNDQGFRWNNYLSRFHYRHLDLMDVLAAYQPRANAPLDTIASLLGFPGKMGMSGMHVWEQYQAGDIKPIRDYCETDVLNTYLVYLRFELMRGNLTPTAYGHALSRVKTLLNDSEHPHWQAFLKYWEETSEM